MIKNKNRTFKFSRISRRRSLKRFLQKRFGDKMRNIVMCIGRLILNEKKF